MEIMPVARMRGQAAGEEWVLSDKVGIFDFYGSLRYKSARAKDSHSGRDLFVQNGDVKSPPHSSEEVKFL